ncbi:hypothetical protein V1477_019290 [Vespula maculifrons]|uniref:Uncharacterized protein n=1 Tax=Vespula maculifrons TaxID=7453 RepID=A0ABD2AS38_VESMC
MGTPNPCSLVAVVHEGLSPNLWTWKRSTSASRQSRLSSHLNATDVSRGAITSDGRLLTRTGLYRAAAVAVAVVAVAAAAAVAAAVAAAAAESVAVGVVVAVAAPLITSMSESGDRLEEYELSTDVTRNPYGNPSSKLKSLRISSVSRISS